MSPLILLTIIALVYGSTERFSTNNKLVYASWSVCDSCQCDSIILYAIEFVKQNPSDPSPPVYVYGYHSVYNYCNHTYKVNYFQNVNSIVGLEISRSGRIAEFINNNMTDSLGNNVTINLNWSTKDSDNINNCNCYATYSSGSETIRIQSKSTYRLADLSGYITINGTVFTAPNSTYSYIAGYGQKVISTQHQ